jgi:hypothetical protein
MTASDAAAWVTAGATAVLTISIVVAIAQVNQERSNAKVERTLPILKEWNRPRIQTWLWYVDYYTDLDKSRRATNRLFSLARPRRRDEIDDFLTDIARLAERTEILFRRELIDRDVLAEHLSYDILQAFYCLQDIFAELAAKKDLHFLGFYRLAISLQPYYRNLPSEEVITKLANCTFIKPVMPDDLAE